MGDPWGMIYGGSGYPDSDDPAELARLCAEKAARLYRWGVRSSRVGVCWCNVEKVRGQYDWSKPDARIPAIARSGIHIVLCVATTPEWAWQHPEAAEILRKRGQPHLAGCLPNKPEYWPDYERYLAALVKRYRKYLKHYELWNEPDGMAGFRFVLGPDGKCVDVHYGGDPVWYAELVKRSYKVIKSIDREARVGIGSFEKKDPKNTWFFEQLYKQGIKPYYDAISIHPYGNPFGRAWLGTVRRIMVEQGEGHKPIWITEYSLHGKGLGLAFNVRRQLRLLRETPWISVAQPLVFECHFDKKICPQGWSLRAHKQMSEEYAPRTEFVADFEAPAMELLDHWEWNATGARKYAIEGPKVSSDFPHHGERCLAAKTTGPMLRLWFTPYVKAKDRVFSGSLLVEPQQPDAKLSLTIGVESGDILQDIREVRPYRRDVPTGKWFDFAFGIDEHFADWRDLTVVTCYVEITSDKPGLSVSIDDVRVGSRRPRPVGDATPASRPRSAAP